MLRYLDRFVSGGIAAMMSFIDRLFSRFDVPSWSASKWVFVFTLLFLINLPFCTVMGYQIAQRNEGGPAGVYSAILLLFVMGAVLCLSLPLYHRQALSLGMMVVAFTQLCPYLHFITGMFSSALMAKCLGFQNESEMFDFKGSFLVAMITGQCICFYSWVIGLYVLHVRRGKDQIANRSQA